MVGVGIFSVPVPESLHSESEEGLPLYRVSDEAVVTLDPLFSPGTQPNKDVCCRL